MFLLTMNNNTYKGEYNFITTKMAMVETTIENSLFNIADLVNHMNLDSLNIFSISINNTMDYEYLELNSPSNIKYLEMSALFFMENILDNPDYDFWKYNLNSLYIVRNGNFSDIQEMFISVQERKTKVVKGNSVKAHMVSALDFRLSSYLMILCNMDYKLYYKGHSFNKVNKTEYS